MLHWHPYQCCYWPVMTIASCLIWALFVLEIEPFRKHMRSMFKIEDLMFNVWGLSIYFSLLLFYLLTSTLTNLAFLRGTSSAYSEGKTNMRGESFGEDAGAGKQKWKKAVHGNVIVGVSEWWWEAWNLLGTNDKQRIMTTLYSLHASPASFRKLN